MQKYFERKEVGDVREAWLSTLKDLNVCSQKERQISFNEYVTRLRIEHAKQLLEESGSSIESIAREIGYTNPKYFFKVFKKMVGETPQEYRKNRR